MKTNKYPILLSPFESDYDISSLTTMETELGDPSYYSVRSKRAVDFGKLLLVHRQSDLTETEVQNYWKKISIYQTLASIDSPLVPKCHVCYINRDIFTHLTTIYFVFEYLDSSVYTFLKNKKNLTLFAGLRFLKDATYLLSRAFSKGFNHNAISAKAILLNTSNPKEISLKLMNWNGQTEVDDSERDLASPSERVCESNSINPVKTDSNISLAKKDSYSLAIVLLELIGASKDFIVTIKRTMRGVVGRIPLEAHDSIDTVFCKIIQNCLLGKEEYRMTPMQIISHINNYKLNTKHEILLDSISPARFFDYLLKVEQDELKQLPHLNKISFRWSLLGIERATGDVENDQEKGDLNSQEQIENEIENEGENMQVSINHNRADHLSNSNLDDYNSVRMISVEIEEEIEEIRSTWMQNPDKAYSKSFGGAHRRGKSVDQNQKLKIKIIINSPERKSIAWIGATDKFEKMKLFLLEQGELEEIAKRNIVFYLPQFKLPFEHLEKNYFERKLVQVSVEANISKLEIMD